MKTSRRTLLRALGLGALCSLAGKSGSALADPTPVPSRVVFFVTPHGHVPSAWTMPVTGANDQFVSRSLTDLSASEFSAVLRPLHPFRDRLLAIEGLSHTSVLADVAEISRTGGDLNSHSISVAGLLTGARALQRNGAPCTGGARSIDQELAARTSAPGRFGSRVYGADYVPNASVAPFSFLGRAGLAYRPRPRRGLFGFARVRHAHGGRSVTRGDAGVDATLGLGHRRTRV